MASAGVGARLFLAAGLALPVLGGGGSSASAADTDEIIVLEQPFAVTAANSGSIIVDRVAAARSSDTVVVTAYPRTVSRATFRAIADDHAPLQTTVDSVRFRYGSLRIRGQALVIPLSYGLDVARTSALDLGRPGVYPVAIEVRRGTSLVARTLTFLYRPDQRPRVRATVIVGQVHPPAHQPDGSIVVSSEMRRRLGELASMTALAGGALTAYVSPELLTALASSPDDADAALHEQLQTAVGGATLSAKPYSPVDPARLVSEQLGDELARQFRLGETATISALPGTRVQRGVFVARAALDASSADAMADLGIRTLVFADGAPPASDIAPVGMMTAVEAGAGVGLKGVAAIDGVSDLLRDGRQPVIAGVRVAAELMMVRRDLLDGGHPADSIHLVVDAVDADPLDSTAVLTLVSALKRSSAVSIVGEAAIDDTPPVEDVTESLSPEPAAYPDRNMGAVMYTLVTRRAALASMLPADDGRLDRWEATLGLIPALEDPAVINDYVSAMQRDMNSLADAISISVGSTVTLGNRAGRIPLRLRNSLDTPLTVRVRVASAKLILGQGPRVFTVPATSAIDVSIDVKARSNGSFPVRVTLITPEGNVVVEPTATITARVSAIAGLGQLVSVSIGLVLLAWWFAHWRRSRRPEALPPTPAGETPA